jgi:serine phosphatase RsbU (regulator of sigma subunit)
MSIAAKLILASSIVVAAAVAGSAWFSDRTIGELAKSHAASRRTQGEAAISRESDLIVAAAASAAALPLGTNAFADLQPVLETAMRDDAVRARRRVRWLVITDVAGQIAAQTAAAPLPDQLARFEARLPASPNASVVGVVHARLDDPTEWIYAASVILGNRVVGRVRMGVSSADLESELTASIRAAAELASSSRRRIWMIALVLLVVGTVLAAFQGVSMARPIRALTRHATRIARGHFHDRVLENRRDELGTLAHSFNFMAERIGQLLAEQAQKASLEREMSLARMVQQSMLPSSALDEHGACKIIGYCEPASSCGGDWWTYRKLGAGRVLIVVGDATGHGIHSAMIAATARGAVEALFSVDESLLTPEGVLRAIDRAIRDVGDHNVQMTCFAALLDPAAGSLHYANAGQNFPYLVRMGDSRTLQRATIIAASGNALGDRTIPLEVRRGSVQVGAGDLFVCFTDGLVERSNRAGRLFGDRRLCDTLQGQHLADSGALVTLRDHLVTTVHQFAEGTTADDDITFVLCQFDPPAATHTADLRGMAS